MCEFRDVCEFKDVSEKQVPPNLICWLAWSKWGDVWKYDLRRKNGCNVVENYKDTWYNIENRDLAGIGMKTFIIKKIIYIFDPFTIIVKWQCLDKKLIKKVSF